MNLPRKDNHGISYLSYSQLSLFKKDKGDYYDRYILDKPFEGNEYTEFGSKVGGALEHDDYSAFEPAEQSVLMQCVRLDEFEREVRLHYPEHGFYVKGFIDTNLADLSRIIDYKTGGEGKEAQYTSGHYSQLHIYALALRQETGITPSKAQVNFIRRAGKPQLGETLTVANEAPQLFDIDISISELKRVYWETLATAKKIEQFYLKYKGDKANV